MRLLIAFLIGVIPAYYIYIDEGDALETSMNEAKDKLSALEVKFEKERAKRSKLPELEAKLAFTEQQLKESSKLLPDTFLMNDVLQETSTIARDVGVELQVFDPGTATAGGDAFKYMEMPIELIISGKYSQIASFYDRLANLEKMVHVRNFKMTPLKAGDEKRAATLASQSSDPSETTSQRAARTDFRIEASAAMVIYRAMTAAEEMRLAPPPPPPVKASGAPGSVESPAAPPDDSSDENTERRRPSSRRSKMSEDPEARVNISHSFVYTSAVLPAGGSSQRRNKRNRAQ